jgi:hypothetical protein
MEGSRLNKHEPRSRPIVDPSLVMRTFSSFNHLGPDEVPIAILLRQSALKASVGTDPIERRPSSGGHPSWAIPHGTAPP